MFYQFLKQIFNYNNHLVEMPESFNEILDSVSDLLLGHLVKDGQEGLEGHPAFIFLALNQALNFSLGRVLAQGANDFTHLIGLK